MTRPPTDPHTVAAFDFDRTLTVHDSVVPFLKRLAPWPRRVRALLRNSPQVIIAAARRDRDALRAIATRSLIGGIDRDSLADHATAQADAVISDGLRHEMVERVAWHRSQGHTVVIVSASYGDYVRPVAEHLGIDHVLATELDLADDGRYTGDLVGANCRGAEKVARLDRLFASLGLDRSTVTLWADGDSAGDREMLAWADHPVWVTASSAR